MYVLAYVVVRLLWGNWDWSARVVNLIVCLVVQWVVLAVQLMFGVRFMGDRRLLRWLGDCLWEAVLVSVMRSGRRAVIKELVHRRGMLSRTLLILTFRMGSRRMMGSGDDRE